MKKIMLMAAVIMIIVGYGPAYAENITVNGDMKSRIHLLVSKKVTTFPGIQTLTLGFVAPETFTSPTYRQDIHGFDLQFIPPPAEQTSQVDSLGNRVVRASWKTPPESIDIRISVEASNVTRLGTIHTSAPFPLTGIPADIAYYLRATSQVQADDVRIRNLAAELVRDVQTEFAAVQRIITFVVDYLSYVPVPEKHDAVYSLASRRGNCQNYSHLSAALMRACGIPVRIVNGITLSRPVSIDREGAMLTYKMGKGRHSWIEVWFPDLGWVPFDPQQTAMFVLNRFIRIETGADNNETIKDGLVSWSLTGVRQGDLKVQEMISEDFAQDDVALKGRKEVTGPKSYLLYPFMKADVTNREVTLPLPSATPSPAVKAEAKPAGPAAPLQDKAGEGTSGSVSPAALKASGATAENSSAMPSGIEERTRIAFKAEKGAVEKVPASGEGRVTLGNLEFPSEIDFAFPPSPVVTKGENSFQKTKSFFVETAEFVTSMRTQYAQAFVIESPLSLESIGLALHHFGGDGHLWIDVHRDDGSGQPGSVIATSDMIDLDHLSSKPGYRWTDFSFSKNKAILTPGNYWIALGFTGSPVINWFYTYGKPVGPTEGTRYKGIDDKNWRGALNYEFNYRVAGVRVK